MSTSNESIPLDNLHLLREGWEFEAKLAQGRDGQGHLALHGLVQRGMLQSRGSGRYTTYTIPGRDEEEGHSESGSDSNDVGSDSNDVGSDSNDVGSDSNDVGSEPDFVHRVTSRKRVKSEVLKRAILFLCATEYVTPDELALRLNRGVRNLQNRFLRPMVREGLLTMAYPKQPSHPKQAYRAVAPEESN